MPTMSILEVQGPLPDVVQARQDLPPPRDRPSATLVFVA